MGSIILRCILAGGILIGVVRGKSVATSCSSTLSASYPAPSVANGYVARLVAQDLESPRGIKFDSEDHLMIIESGVGITAITFDDAGDGCITEASRKTLVDNPELNHGIELSEDGSTLYASSTEAAFSWDYDAKSQSTTSDSTTLVNGMSGSDHATRTLLLSKKAPGMLVVTRGSFDNIDPLAKDKSSGSSQVKAFDLNNIGDGPYSYVDDGLLLGWGLRNDVGIDEEPQKGGIYSVENSVDQILRDGTDIHNTNPAEEMNFLGYLDGTSSSNQGRNFGYPECFTAWDTSVIKGFSGQTGEQFAIGDFSMNNTNGDAMCNDAHRQAARLGFHPHMAPLDILFNDDGTVAWVTFHGSWDSDVPVGYKLSVVTFDGNGEPTEPSTSQVAAIDILSNHDTTQCYCNDGCCFRPVGLAWDSQGRLFMSSDETGEIYAILRADGKPTMSTEGNPGPLPNSASLFGTTSMKTLAAITILFAFML